MFTVPELELLELEVLVELEAVVELEVLVELEAVVELELAVVELELELAVVELELAVVVELELAVVVELELAVVELELAVVELEVLPALDVVVLLDVEEVLKLMPVPPAPPALLVVLVEPAPPVLMSRVGSTVVAQAIRPIATAAAPRMNACRPDFMEDLPEETIVGHARRATPASIARRSEAPWGCSFLIGLRARGPLPWLRARRG
jgi:hypothetical protein